MAVVLAALATGLLVGSPAVAATSAPEDSVAEYDLVIDVDSAGIAQVTLDLEMDFGATPNRGPFLTYLVKQRHDDAQDRVYRISDVEVDSPTGASDAVDIEEDGSSLVIRIGEEDRTDLTGLHTYRLTFQVEGWVNSAEVFGNADDELYLNVITDWELPVRDVWVTVIGPTDVQQAFCFAGRSSSEPCDTAQVEEGVATFTHDELPPGDDLTIVATFPAGAFGGVEPILQNRWSADRAFALTPATGTLTVLLALVGGALVLVRLRRSGWDQEYRGLTPGLRPVQGFSDGDRPGHASTAVGPRRRGPVAVQYTPPEGLRPGQLGTLVDEHADPHDVTATLVDLAVRGYLRIEVDPGPDEGGTGSDWRLVRTGPTSDTVLLPYEQRLLQDVFEGRDVVLLSDLRTTFASSMAAVQQDLYDDVTERGWFRGNPRSVRLRWVAGGVLLVLLGVALTVALATWTSWGLLGLPVILVGVLVVILAKAAPARTADGSAVLAQAEGFRLYLATAEADQLRLEEGQDLFSRYLPYAIAFGLTERWAKVFADLAAQGHTLPEPGWYVGGYAHGAFWAGGGITRDLAGFTRAAGEAISAPTPGSSGSSGSSGGGFSGGGVGGGGGGSW